jgi:putative restriction endonuclease
MAALNSGFDSELREIDGWLFFASSQTPLQIWLRDEGPADYLVALSHLHVARALGGLGDHTIIPLPPDAVAARLVPSIPALHELLRRAFQLSRALPDQPLHRFETQTADLPRATEIERLVVQRVGQDIFRAALLEYWDGRCAVTGLAIPELLRASHIKPWAACTTDAERLDVFNGLLLAPHLDAAFDAGFITFADSGVIAISDDLSASDLDVLGIHPRAHLRSVDAGHRAYLAWHRVQLFQQAVRNHERA